MKLGIIGPGLIGGSMGLDLLSRGFADEVFGVEKDPVAADAAVRLGLVGAVLSLEECVRRSDVLVLAGDVSYLRCGKSLTAIPKGRSIRPFRWSYPNVARVR